MWKSDLPPSYEESRDHPPAYGFTQPGMNYPSPHPSQTAQSQTGMRQGPGYSRSGFPSIIPTSRSSPEYGQNMDSDYSAMWDSRAVRHAFVRKVYLILAAQLIFTVSIVAVFVFVQPVRLFVVQNPAMYWASFAIYFVTYMALICCEPARRRHPLNLVLLSAFTIAMSYMTGTISSFYDTKAVFLALGITAIVCIIVTIFSFQTKVDFTACSGLFCVLGIVVMVTGIITAIVLSFQYIPWLHMLYAAIGAIVFTLFLAYDTQLLIGNRTHSLSPEEYVYGALALYVDIVQIFLFLLQLLGSSE
ncbi:protein lifeguard 3 [Engraulis encrasicolus]|uniref:protein lifeguard 3 n=1 Tax=Engraulis encrasicolus TaxID=184585 RepID=UPI002FCEB874